MGEISRGAARAGREGGKEADRSKKFVCRTEDGGQDNLGEKCGQSSQWPSPYVSLRGGKISKKGILEPRLFHGIIVASNSIGGTLG